jgi:hypothetical protein
MPEIAEAQALLTEGLWAPGTQDGSQRLPGGGRSLAKLVSAAEFPVYQGNCKIFFDS